MIVQINTAHLLKVDKSPFFHMGQVVHVAIIATGSRFRRERTVGYEGSYA